MKTQTQTQPANKLALRKESIRLLTSRTTATAPGISAGCGGDGPTAIDCSITC
jgi:hypothetical protein